MTTELTLPKCSHELSKSVESELKRLDGLLHPTIRTVPALRQQFWAQAIVEVNGLKPNTNMGSVLVAIANVCQVGLMFGKQLGHAYLVPYGGNAQLVIGYKGFLKLAYGCDFLASLTTELILKGESPEFWVDETGRKVKHAIPINRPEPSIDNVEGAYCVYQTKSGHRDVVLAHGWEIQSLYRKAHQNSVWKSGGPSGFQGQCLKTPIRRAAKLWDQSPELARAVYLDEQADRDESQDCPELEPPRLSEADGLRATLMATLRDKVGCKDGVDRRGVLDAAGFPLMDVADLTSDQCNEAMDWLTRTAQSSEIGWAGVLPHARS